MAEQNQQTSAAPVVVLQTPPPAVGAQNAQQAAQNNTTPKPIIAAFTFDEGKFQQAVINQETYLKDFIGKPGHNPFFQLNQLGRMRKDYHKGVRTEQLFDEAMKFLPTPPAFGAPLEVKTEAPKEASKPFAG